GTDVQGLPVHSEDHGANRHDEWIVHFLPHNLGESRAAGDERHDQKHPEKSVGHGESFLDVVGLAVNSMRSVEIIFCGDSLNSSQPAFTHLNAPQRRFNDGLTVGNSAKAWRSGARNQEARSEKPQSRSEKLRRSAMFIVTPS